jgi:ATP-dependent DNA helicase RecQ
MVFSDATLRAMVRRRPQTAEELLQVSGVGQVKLERYGKAFLRELEA